MDDPGQQALNPTNMPEFSVSEISGAIKRTLEGEFGRVTTSVSYNLPATGLDLSGGYVGADYFRFGDYAPAVWQMNGLYTSTPALQPVIAAPGPSEPDSTPVL